MKKTYILTEKGAESYRRFGTPAQAGDPYDRPVSESLKKKYVKAGFITEVSK